MVLLNVSKLKKNGPVRSRMLPVQRQKLYFIVSLDPHCSVPLDLGALESLVYQRRSHSNTQDEIKILRKGRETSCAFGEK